MDFGPLNYSDKVVPKKYKCSKCGARGVKLWRQYNKFACYIDLLCCICAGKDQNKDVSKISANGHIPNEYGPIDQIGWLVPAIPTEEGDTYWGYTSVPQEGVEWWHSLPNTNVEAACPSLGL